MIDWSGAVLPISLLTTIACVVLRQKIGCTVLIRHRLIRRLGACRSRHVGTRQYFDDGGNLSGPYLSGVERSDKLAPENKCSLPQSVCKSKACTGT